jgi:hypothetical protein
MFGYRRRKVFSLFNFVHRNLCVKGARALLFLLVENVKMQTVFNSCSHINESGPQSYIFGLGPRNPFMALNEEKEEIRKRQIAEARANGTYVAPGTIAAAATNGKGAGKSDKPKDEPKIEKCWERVFFTSPFFQNLSVSPSIFHAIPYTCSVSGLSRRATAVQSILA